jgi:hypothetical protein
MQNNMPILYILELYSSVAKKAKNFNCFISFCPKNEKNKARIAMVIRKYP